MYNIGNSLILCIKYQLFNKIAGIKSTGDPSEKNKIE